jgi:hypothetical protein
LLRVICLVVVAMLGAQVDRREGPIV